MLVQWVGGYKKYKGLLSGLCSERKQEGSR